MFRACYSVLYFHSCSHSLQHLQLCDTLKAVLDFYDYHILLSVFVDSSDSDYQFISLRGLGPELDHQLFIGQRYSDNSQIRIRVSRCTISGFVVRVRNSSQRYYWKLRARQPDKNQTKDTILVSYVQCRHYWYRRTSHNHSD